MDTDLAKEKAKLKKVNPQQLLDYISQSFEIIINMKSEEAAPKVQPPAEKPEGGSPSSTGSVPSVASTNLIMQSIKEAVLHMNDKKKRRP